MRKISTVSVDYGQIGFHKMSSDFIVRTDTPCLGFEASNLDALEFLSMPPTAIQRKGVLALFCACL